VLIFRLIVAIACSNRVISYRLSAPQQKLFMVEKSTSKPLPATLQQIAVSFRLAGWASFWVQSVLGVVSTLVLLFASLGRDIGPQGQRSAGTGIGIVLAVSGIVTLAIGVYIAFRYTRIAKRLQSTNPNNRPRKADTVQVLRLGLIVNLVGTLLTILGAQAIVGILLLRSLSLPQGLGAAIYNPQQIIRPVDIFVVQANTNTVAAHFVGLVVSLFLLNRVTK